MRTFSILQSEESCIFCFHFSRTLHSNITLEHNVRTSHLKRLNTTFERYTRMSHSNITLALNDWTQGPNITLKHNTQTQHSNTTFERYTRTSHSNTALEQSVRSVRISHSNTILVITFERNTWTSHSNTTLKQNVWNHKISTSTISRLEFANYLLNYLATLLIIYSLRHHTSYYYIWRLHPTNEIDRESFLGGLFLLL